MTTFFEIAVNITLFLFANNLLVSRVVSGNINQRLTSTLLLELVSIPCIEVNIRNPFCSWNVHASSRLADQDHFALYKQFINWQGSGIHQ